MNYRHAYHEHQSTVRAGLRDARSRGQVSIDVTQGSVDPRRLSDRDIESLAIRDAELIVNLAINQQAEQFARKGR